MKQKNMYLPGGKFGDRKALYLTSYPVGKELISMIDVEERV